VSHIKPNCYDPKPTWVPATHDQIWPLMGKTEADRLARRESWRKLHGPPVEPRRRVGIKGKQS
jgi:hypothetical protein